MKSLKFFYGKIVRDKTAERLLPRGAEIKQCKLSKESILAKLKDKLLEEVFEFCHEAKDLDDQVKELADILEVVRGICSQLDLTFEDVEWVRQTRHAERGGFDKAAFFEWVIHREDDPLFKTCLERPEKYPVILEEITDTL